MRCMQYSRKTLKKNLLLHAAIAFCAYKYMFKLQKFIILLKENIKRYFCKILFYKNYKSIILPIINFPNGATTKKKCVKRDDR